MLNPDGVVRGNYRTNTIGVDLNRRWINPSRILHPTIFYAKKLLMQFKEQVLVYIDFHGHSRKRNVFMYGCCSSEKEVNHHRNNNLIKVIPSLLGQRNRLFSLADCKFANEKDKESTGRVVVFKEIGILASYTMESTYYAMYNAKNFKKKRDIEPDQQIKSEDLIQVGEDLCHSFYQLVFSKILKKKFNIEASLAQVQTQPQSRFESRLKQQTSDLLPERNFMKENATHTAGFQVNSGPGSRSQSQNPVVHNSNPL